MDEMVLYQSLVVADPASVKRIKNVAVEKVAPSEGLKDEYA
jgi:hypothetical protein